MTTVRLFRDLDTTEGGGSAPGTTNQEGRNEDGSLQEGYRINEFGEVVKQDPPTNGDEPPEETEGVDAEGNLLDGYERLEDGTIQKIVTDDVEEELTPEDEANQFYEAVSAITGETYEIDYGGVDPISPEGVAIRDKVVGEKYIKNFDEHLKTTYPKAYAYFLHLQAGGQDKDFFEQSTPTLPVRADFEVDTDQQASAVLNDLMAKGVDADVAQATVDKYIKENTLKEKALKIYDTYQSAQQKQLADIDAFNKKQQEEFNNSVSRLLTSFDTAIANDMKLIVPEKKQAEFKKFLQDHTRYDNGKFYFAQEIGQDLPKLLEQLYFKFNNGDIKSLVERQARSITTQRLRTAVNKDKKTQNTGADSRQTPEGFVPLGSIKFH